MDIAELNLKEKRNTEKASILDIIGIIVIELSNRSTLNHCSGFLVSSKTVLGGLPNPKW